MQQTLRKIARKLTGLPYRSYLVALRPHQWTKNIIVVAAPLFAFNINAKSFLDTTLAFVLFCCVSSSFYLLNDIADVESDRWHQVKCRRPIAAGLVNIKIALVIAVTLLTIALIIGWLRMSALGMTLTGYALLQIAYNLKLKHKPIVDIIAISLGFILRAYGGAVINQVHLSPWFVLCTAMLSLFLGIEKRKAELRLSQIKGIKTRSVLKHYSLPLLIRMESTVTSCTIMSYGIWSIGPVVNGATTPWMMLTMPFVLYGIFRYQLLSDPQDRYANQEITERPDEVLLRDRAIFVTDSLKPSKK